MKEKHWADSGANAYVFDCDDIITSWLEDDSETEPKTDV